MGSNAIGEIPVIITGDFSKLDDALNDSIIAAELGGQKIAAALTRGSEGADQLGISLNDIASSAHAASMSAQEFASGLDKLIDEKFGATTAQEAAQALEANAEAQRSAAAAAHALDEALGPMPASFTEMSAAQQRSVEHLNEVSQAFQTADAGGSKLINTLLGFAGITLTFAGLKTALTEAFAAFDRVDDATTALTALTGSAKNAAANIDQIRALAQTDALSFPALLKADQNMVAFGIDTAKVPGLLQAAADSAAVTGRSFDSAAQALERIVASGNAGGRQLVSLGLTMKDLASVMGVAETQASKMFKALDEGARVEVVTEALAKFKGLAEATTQDAGGAFQRFRNVVDQELGAIGKALDGTEQGVIRSTEGIVRSLSEMIQSSIQVGKEFTSMGLAVEAAIAGITAAIARNPWAAVGLEIVRLGLALKGLQKDLEDTDKAVDQSNKQFSLMITQVRQLLSPVPELAAQFEGLVKQVQQGQISWEQFQLKTRDVVASFRELHPVVSQVTDTHKSFTSAVQELKKELDAHIITQDQYKQKIHDLIASYGNLNDAVKTHSNVMVGINESYKQWADTLTHLGQSYGNIFEAIEKTSAAAGNSRMTFIPLNDQVKAFIDYTRSMAASATDTSRTITVLTGHLTDVDKTLPHLGTSISVTTVKMDEFGHVTNAAADAAKKFVDASSSMAAQLQAGMTVITGHASATRDLNSVLTDAGVKLSTVSGGTDTLNSALHALFAPTTQTTANVQQFALSLGTADTAANLLTTDLSPLEQRLAALDGGFARAANSARGFAQVLSDDLLAGTLGAGSTGGLSGGTGGRGGRGGASLFDPNNPSAGGISLSNGALSIVIPGSSVQVPTHHSSAGAEPTAPIGGVLGGIDFGMLATGIPTALNQATPAAQQFVNAVDAVTQTFADASSAMITSATAVAATVNIPPPSEFAAGSTFATPSAATVPTPLSIPAPSQWQRGTVNIYNPTVTNQTQLDQMLTQLQNSGLNTR